MRQAMGAQHAMGATAAVPISQGRHAAQHSCSPPLTGAQLPLTLCKLHQQDSLVVWSQRNACGRKGGWRLLVRSGHHRNGGSWITRAAVNWTFPAVCAAWPGLAWAAPNLSLQVAQLRLTQQGDDVGMPQVRQARALCEEALLQARRGGKKVSHRGQLKASQPGSGNPARTIVPSDAHTLSTTASAPPPWAAPRASPRR